MRDLSMPDLAARLRNKQLSAKAAVNNAASLDLPGWHALDAAGRSVGSYVAQILRDAWTQLDNIERAATDAVKAHKGGSGNG
jgi:hypothetical protein